MGNTSNVLKDMANTAELLWRLNDCISALELFRAMLDKADQSTRRRFNEGLISATEVITIISDATYTDELFVYYVNLKGKDAT